MKVTILALHLGFGGIEKYIKTIANILCEEHDVEILSTYKILEKPAFSIDSRVKIKYLSKDVIPNEKEFKNALKNKKILLLIKEGMKSLRILYLKNKINRNAIKKCDSDIIISTREYHNEMIQKYANDKIIKIATEHNHPCGDEKYIKRVVESCKGFDYLLPISKELTTFYTVKFINTKTQVKYIPFCVDKPNCSMQHNFEKPIYISVGRLSPEKGILELIELFSKIVAKQEAAILHLVGDGILMPQVKEKINMMSMEKNVIVHGFLRKEIIDKLYCESSIFLMTSLTESFGFVLLEAMSCGLPCIAFDSAQGANEIIENGVNGYLIKNRNINEFVYTTSTLFEDKNLINQMSQNALQTSKEFSYDNTKKQWLDFLDGINNNIKCK